MKWIIAFAVIALFACAHAEEDELLAEEAGSPRLGFITVNNDGTTSLTFNATSIQNAVILGLFLLVLGALLLPLLGGLGDDSGSGYGYGDTSGYTSGGYEQPSQGYSTYSKRSADFMGPLMEGLASAYKKYNDDEE